MTKEVFAIYYTFENSCFMRLKTEQGYRDTIDKNPFEVLSCKHYNDLSLFDIPEILGNQEQTIGYGVGYTYSRDVDVWCNSHRTLEKLIKKQFKGSLSFLDETKAIRTHINNLYKSLKAIDKVIIKEGINTTIPYFEDTLLIGLFGLYNDIFNKSK